MRGLMHIFFSALTSHSKYNDVASSEISREASKPKVHMSTSLRFFT